MEIQKNGILPGRTYKLGELVGKKEICPIKYTVDNNRLPNWFLSLRRRLVPTIEPGVWHYHGKPTIKGTTFEQIMQAEKEGTFSINQLLQKESFSVRSKNYVFAKLNRVCIMLGI